MQSKESNVIHHDFKKRDRSPSEPPNPSRRGLINNLLIGGATVYLGSAGALIYELAQPIEKPEEIKKFRERTFIELVIQLAGIGVIAIGAELNEREKAKAGKDNQPITPNK